MTFQSSAELSKRDFHQTTTNPKRNHSSNQKLNGPLYSPHDCLSLPIHRRALDIHKQDKSHFTAEHTQPSLPQPSSRQRREADLPTSSEAVTQPSAERPLPASVSSQQSQSLLGSGGGGDIMPLLTPGERHTTTNPSPLLVSAPLEVNSDSCPSRRSGGWRDGGQNDSREGHDRGVGGLLTVFNFGRKSVADVHIGGGNEDDSSAVGGRSDSDKKYVVAQGDMRGKSGYRRRSVVSKQIMDLKDTAASEVAAGSQAHSNLIQRLTTVSLA